MDLEFSERVEAGHTVVALRGELDLTSADQVRDYLLGALAGRPGSIIMDLTGLAFLDCAGLRVLTGAGRCARQLGVSFALAGPQGIVARVIHLVGLAQHYAIYATVAGAAAGQVSGDLPADGGTLTPG